MSDLEETNSYTPDMQETYDDDTNKDSIERLANETQKETSINESQDFHLIVSEEEENLKDQTVSAENKESNPQASTDQLNLQHISHAPESSTDQDIITASEGEDREVALTEKKSSNDTNDSDKNETESLHSDGDEVIQGTPPLMYSPRKSIGSSIDVTSLKRKTEFSNEPPSKLQKTEDTVISPNRDFEEDRHSVESNDSYQDLFTNTDKNIVIEETQDLNNQEVIQDSLSKHIETIETKNDDKIQEQLSQCQNAEEDMEKDENLNVSMKVNDSSMNDSTNVNSANESDLQVEDDSTSMGARKDVSKKSENEITSEANKFLQIKDDTEANKAEQDFIEPVKTANGSDKTSSSQSKASGEVKTTNKSRTSVELIYDDANASSKAELMEIVLDSSSETICDRKDPKGKPEVVEIVDDSREKIVLDSFEESTELQTTLGVDKSLSHESKTYSDFSHKESTKESSLDSRVTQSKKQMNGSTESKQSDTDATLSVKSDTFSGCDLMIDLSKGNAAQNAKNANKGNSFTSKDLDNIELISISDNEISNTEEKNKSELHNSALAKAAQVEREIGMYVKLKCVLHVDDNTKEFLSKEVTMVQCEPVTTESASVSKHKNEDSQGSLADISDNKESSPGSVTSNLQPYVLNPSRLSIMSSVSSSSSASSAASLALKLSVKSLHFSVPSGPAKHAKKSTQEFHSVAGDKQLVDEAYERVTHEWKNHRLLTATILNSLNTEINSSVTAGVVQDSYVNVSNDRLYDHLQKSNMRSSTPEVATTKNEIVSTPKSSKKGRGVKRVRSKPAKPSAAQTNGVHKKEVVSTSTRKESPLRDHDSTRSDRKKSRTESVENKLSISEMNSLTNSSPSDALGDDLIGKHVFAKWSDNKYYAGMVCGRVKTKYRVNFCDGKSKELLAEFVIPIPKMLREGLSVYASKSDDDDYSCGIIVDAQAPKNSNNANDIYYIVETDNNKERFRVQVRNIVLSPDQAQVLKEDMESANRSLMPSTPKALHQVTLDNVVEGKRRSKRIGNNTPVLSTPKSRSNAGVGGGESASRVKAEPSVSGMSGKGRVAWLEAEVASSDSNVEVKDESQTDLEYTLLGVQKEINSTPCDLLDTKGPQNRIKSKPRSKKKEEDEHIVATLGPIPSAKSNIFKDMSFILTCADEKTLDRFRYTKVQAYSTGTETNESEAETEYESDWMGRSFLRSRLHEQILAGGGKVYEDFDQIPKNEYKNTKLITNVPNTTAKGILCLSVGIPAYNHKWIIRCCLEGKTVNPAEEALPTGWSLQKNDYVEAFQARENKPLSKTFVIIPRLLDLVQFATFWQQVCENAGAVVLIVDDSGAMETVESNVVIVSNIRCPLWAVDSANKLRIPILSTTWVVQCLIEGKFCPHDQHPEYRYNYKPN